MGLQRRGRDGLVFDHACIERGHARATVGSIAYQFVAAYREDGVGLAGLSNLGCTPRYYGQNSLGFPVEAGRTYYIQAGAANLTFGTMTVRLEWVPPPANDDFVNATAVNSLPFSDSVDATASGRQQSEPSASCGSPPATVWYAFTPTRSGSYTASSPYNGNYNQIAVYTGSGLGNLGEIGCRQYYQVLSFHADAGTTYYFQVGGSTTPNLRFQLDGAPPPNASFWTPVSDPSSLDTVPFYDQSNDPGGYGFSSEVWSFGDGSASLTNPGCCPTHRYTTDGDYTVKLTVTTTDGRTASSSVTLHVRTHDVAIARVSVPQTARLGQSKTITVGLANTRYAETVQVQLYRSVAGGGWQPVGTMTQYVPIRGGGRTTDFVFAYTFAPEDAAVGKVNFQAVASLVSARDAFPTDNTFVSLPTKVTG
jgi:PKD repeat protein